MHKIFLFSYFIIMNVLFIDSGIGGLSVLTETIRDLPNLNFIYYADSAYAPYGSKTKAQLTARLKEIINHFASNVNIVVLACNTATTNAIEDLRKIFSFKIIGSEPAIKPASKIADKVLLICTPLTAKSKKLKALIKTCGKKVRIVAPKNLASNIDKAFVCGDSKAKQEIENSLSSIALEAKDFEAIVLGCTHYCFVKNKLSDITKLPVLDGNFGIKQQIKKYVTQQNLSSTPNREFIVSDKNKELVKKYQIIFLQTLAKLQDV